MRIYLLLASSILAGCSGLDGGAHFKCQAPEGIGCSSLSGTYANAVVENLPGSPTKKSTTYSKDGAERDRGITGSAPSSGTPVLSTPKVLRVWVAPWEDARKVLHDQSFLYAVVDPGHWQIAHSQRRILDQYRLLSPVTKRPATGQGGQSPGTQNQPQHLPVQDTTAIAPISTQQNQMQFAPDTQLNANKGLN